MEFIHNYFLVNQEVDLKTILDESTTYVKLSNSELHTSSHSYCQIIKLDLMMEKYVAAGKKESNVRLNCFLLIMFLVLLFTVFIIVI